MRSIDSFLRLQSRFQNNLKLMIPLFHRNDQYRKKDKNYWIEIEDFSGNLGKNGRSAIFWLEIFSRRFVHSEIACVILLDIPLFCDIFTSRLLIKTSLYCYENILSLFDRKAYFNVFCSNSEFLFLSTFYSLTQNFSLQPVFVQFVTSNNPPHNPPPQAHHAPSSKSHH